MGLGLYFIFIRPLVTGRSMLYENFACEDSVAHRGFLIQLFRVFSVIGSFMVATGSLTTHIAITTFQQLRRDVRFVVALASLNSIGCRKIFKPHHG